MGGRADALRPTSVPFPQTKEILATLQWSEPRAIFPTPGRGGFTDVNLYLLDKASGRCLAVSNARQANGVGDTIEQILYDSAPGAAAVS